jgi:alpha-L-rhamnosidase
MMGSVSSWFFKYLGGIEADPAAPGFRHFFIRPGIVPQVGWAEVSYLSPYGRIRSAWRLGGKRLTLRVSVPVNSTATVYFPGGASGPVSESGLPAATAPGVKFLGMDGGISRIEVGSGEYVFVSAPQA